MPQQNYFLFKKERKYLDGFLYQNGHSINVKTKGAHIVQNLTALSPKAVLRTLGSPIWNCQAGLDILPSPP